METNRNKLVARLKAKKSNAIRMKTMYEQEQERLYEDNREGVITFLKDGVNSYYGYIFKSVNNMDKRVARLRKIINRTESQIKLLES